MNNKCMPFGEDINAPSKLPYAQAWVVTQREGEDMFEPMEALMSGTIYPALFMPYKFWRFKDNER